LKKIQKDKEDFSHWHFDGMSKNLSKEYAPSKIDPPKLSSLKHLRKNVVNQTIDKINQVITILFKQKIKPDE
jgi:hypothetical protein